jgi:hypothetical protein
MPDTHDTSETDPNAAAAPRQPTPEEVLCARPVEGEIDHKALTQEIMARFPKILAALAK